MLLRRIILTAVAALVAVPAIASAEPAITAPTPLALQKFKPKFSWTVPANEELISISISPSPAVDAEGSVGTTNGAYISPTDSTQLSATGSRVLAAGTYYYNAWWKTIEPYATYHTAVQSITIPPYLTAFRGSIQQYHYISAVNVQGQYVTNIKSSKILCQIYRGKRVISRDSMTRSYNNIAGLNKFYCSDLRVSERLDGAKLRLKVTFISGGKARAVAWKAFRAV